MSSSFFDRLVARIDKVDPENLQSHMLRLVQERGFLETIFQTIQEGVVVIDHEGKLLYVNRAAELLTGIDFARSKGRSVLRWLRDWDWEHLLDLAEADEGWGRVVTREVEISYPQHRCISVYAMPLNEEKLVDRGMLIFMRDVTGERQQAASTLESERSNAVKLLAAGVAHEIGNPLNALNIHLQLLTRELRTVAPDKRQPLENLVEVARNEVVRLDLIIRQFLQALRPSPPDLHPENVADVLRETLTLLRSEFENRRISVELALPNEIPPVHLDRSQIKQVFFNVIKNSLEAMQDGAGIEITFKVDDAFVEVVFADRGHGMSPEQLHHIFEPYHTTKTGGSGLGLMIVQRIIEDHGGEIEIASKPRIGTSLKLRFPRSERRIRLLTDRQKK